MIYIYTFRIILPWTKTNKYKFLNWVLLQNTTPSRCDRFKPCIHWCMKEAQCNTHFHWGFLPTSAMLETCQTSQWKCMERVLLLSTLYEIPRLIFESCLCGNYFFKCDIYIFAWLLWSFSFFLLAFGLAVIGFSWINLIIIHQTQSLRKLMAIVCLETIFLYIMYIHHMPITCRKCIPWL